MAESLWHFFLTVIVGGVLLGLLWAVSGYSSRSLVVGWVLGALVGEATKFVIRRWWRGCHA